MPANKPTQQRPLLEVHVGEDTFAQLVFDGHATVITWSLCPHVRLRRRPFSAPAMVVVRRGYVDLSLRPYELQPDAAFLL